MGGSNQIPKPNTREIGEFPLIKLSQTTPIKEPAPHQSKEAAPQIQKSHTASTKLSAETKTKRTAKQIFDILATQTKVT